MLDNDLIRLFAPLITNGLSAAGFGTIPLAQAYQPTQQGIVTTPAVYYSKLGDNRVGSPEQIDVWDSGMSVMQHTQLQQYETTFQIMALVISSPNNTNTFTASDLVNAVAQILQSDNTVSILQASNVGILRISAIRNPYFTDDRDDFEASPSFDFTLTHKQINITTDSVINLPVKFDLFLI